MFAWWGRTVYRYRYIVIGVMVALCLGGGVFGISLGNHVTQSGFYDDGSQSVHASLVADKAYGRDTSGHIIGIYTAPEGKTVDDPDFKKKILDNLAQVEKDHPDEILRSIGYFKSPDVLKNMADGDKQHAFMSIQLKGDNDDAILNNYKKVKDDLLKVSDDGVDVKLAGLQPLAAELTGTIGEDQRRAEVAAIPLVVRGVVLRVRRRRRGRPPGDHRRPDHRGRARHHAAGRRVRAGALLRPAGGDPDGPRHRGRLRPVHGQPVP